MNIIIIPIKIPVCFFCFPLLSLLGAITTSVTRVKSAFETAIVVDLMSAGIRRILEAAAIGPRAPSDLVIKEPRLQIIIQPFLLLSAYTRKESGVAIVP